MVPYRNAFSLIQQGLLALTLVYHWTVAGDEHRSERHANDTLLQEIYPLLQGELQTRPDILIHRLESILKITYHDKTSLWKETAQVLLGRAYYANRNYSAALQLFNLIPKDSPHEQTAQIGLAWTAMQLGQLQIAKKAAQRAHQLQVASEFHYQEAQVQLAMLHLLEKNHEQALSLAESAHLSDRHGPEIQAIRIKVIIHARFSLQKNDESILPLAESLPKIQRDPQTSTCIAETYWNIKKYGEAEKWLSPFADSSAKDEDYPLTEDALFLAAQIAKNLGKRDLYAQRMIRLTKFFLNGRYSDESLRLLGQHHETENQWAGSIENYRQLATQADDILQIHAVHRAAWNFKSSGDDWAALRHFEMLSIMQETAPWKKIDGDWKKIKNETVRLLAKLLPATEAMTEIQWIRPTENLQQDWIELAEIYRNLKKPSDAIVTWKELMAHYPHAPNAHLWVKEMITTLDQFELHSAIPTVVRTYVPQLPPSADPSVEKEFSRWLVEETSRSKRHGNWSVAEDGFSVFENLYPNSSQSRVWREGAQHYEDQKSFWKAILWFQLAAGNPEYPERDATARRIASLLTQLETTGHTVRQPVEPRTEHLEKLMTHSRWFIDHFKHLAPEKRKVEKIYIAALYQSARFSEIYSFFSETLQSDGITHDLKDHYEALHESLGSAEKYETIYAGNDSLLSTTVLSEIRNSTWLARAKLKKQESAYLTAKRKVGPEARIWYKKSIQTNADWDLSLQSWNELLLHHSVQSVNADYVLDQAEFEKFFHPSHRLRPQQEKLLFAIYHRKSLYWKNMRHAIEEAKSITQALTHAKHLSDEEIESMSWRAAVLYGAHYQLDSMKQELSRLKEIQAESLSNEDKEILITQLFLWNGDYSEAWHRLQNALSESKDSPELWTLLLDLQRESTRQKDPLAAEIRSYLLENQSDLQQIASLQPLWLQLLYPDASEPTFFLKEVEAIRSPAALPAGNTNLDALLELHALREERIRKYLNSRAPQVWVSALCSLPKNRKETLERLNELQKTKPEFSQEILTKRKELSTQLAREEAFCFQQSQSLVFLSRSPTPESPLCDQSACIPSRPVQSEKIIELEQGWLDPNLTALDKIHLLLQQGAWATAHWVVSETQDSREKALLQGYLRLAAGDSWNAAPLLREAKKSGRLKSYARLLLAKAAAKNGFKGTASAEARKIETSGFSVWAREIYSSLSSYL